MVGSAWKSKLLLLNRMGRRAGSNKKQYSQLVLLNQEVGVGATCSKDTSIPWLPELSLAPAYGELEIWVNGWAWKGRAIDECLTLRGARGAT